MSVLPVDFSVSKSLHKRVLMSHGYILNVLCMMSHCCVTVSNIWASLKLVKAGINQPVFTKERVFVCGKLVLKFTHSYVAMTHENPLCMRLLTRKSTGSTDIAF